MRHLTQLYILQHEISAFIYTSVQPRTYAWVQLKTITITLFKFYMVLVYSFFKLYISKICNILSFYIYIYIYI